MNKIYKKNRKLLVSAFNPQEAREAILGGGRIIDGEDPQIDSARHATKIEMGYGK